MSKIYNEGVNGFHILTLVADGYGNVIAEDTYGRAVATVEWDGNGPDATDAMLKAVRKFVVEAAHQEALDINSEVQNHAPESAIEAALQAGETDRDAKALFEAIKIVVVDQNKNAWWEDEPESTDADRIAYVRNVMGLPGEGPSNWQIEDDGSEMSNAYIAVLKATPEEIERAFGMPPVA